ncbi:MAG: GIN domain-containing protein, partial [Paludibacteraceae bacterium]
MKTKLFSILLIAAGLCGCSLYRMNNIILSGIETEKHYAVSEFTELDVRSAIEVVVCDSTKDICVITDENLLPYLLISQKGKRLSIGYANGTCWTGSTVNRVLVPSQAALDEIAVSGASSVVVEQPLRATDVEIDLSGASMLAATVYAEEVSVNVSGSSKADLQGTVRELSVGISGASQVLAEKQDGQFMLRADDVRGHLSGSSSMLVHSDGTIRCSVSGASTIYFTGNADTSDTDCSGASNIVRE